MHHTIESYKVSDTLNNLEKDSNLKAMTVIRYIVIILMVLTIGTITKASFAKQIAGIVATINDEAISGTDLEARLNFAILTTGLPKTDEVKKSLIPQTLNALIDETLKAQELKKNNVNIDQDEIDLQIEALAQRAKVDKEAFLAKLAEEKIPLYTLENQIRTELGWNRFIQKKLRSKVDVSYNEVQKEIKKIKSHAGEREIRLAEIFIEVQRTENEPEAQKTIQELEKQLKNGAPFPLVAKQFSASASAAKNGEIGWVIPDEIEEDILRETISRLALGHLSPIVRGKNGFYLFYIIDTRTIKGVEKHEILLNIKRIASNELETLKTDVSDIKGCISMDAAYKSFPHRKTGDIDRVPLETLSAPLQNILKPLDIADLSPIIQEGQAYTRYMICRRTYPSRDQSLSVEEITNRIGAEQLDLLQRQYLNKLREQAFVDVRL